MKVSSNQNHNLNFNAQLISQWKCSNIKGDAKSISIIALEKRDLDYINLFRKNLDRYRYLTPIRQAIIDASTQMIKNILEKMSDTNNKIKMFAAIHDGDICGLLVANVPKKLPITESTVYSSRHNPAKNETELDWLVTWNTKLNEKIKGIGKALVSEYFRTVKTDGFRDVYVRSEIPEYSYAVNFYESVGFEKISDKRSKLANKNTNKYVIEDLSNPEDKIIPMIITRRKQREVSEQLEKDFCRQEFVKNSIDLEEYLK